MKIFVTHSAYADLADIQQYYKDEGVAHIGNRFVTAIIDHIQTLVANPDIGRIVPEFSEERIRELIHSPFRIVYLRKKDSLHVIRIWRSERLLKLPEDET